MAQSLGVFRPASEICGPIVLLLRSAVLVASLCQPCLSQYFRLSIVHRPLSIDMCCKFAIGKVYIAAGEFYCGNAHGKLSVGCLRFIIFCF